MINGIEFLGWCVVVVMALAFLGWAAGFIKIEITRSEDED